MGWFGAHIKSILYFHKVFMLYSHRLSTHAIYIYLCFVFRIYNCLPFTNVASKPTRVYVGVCIRAKCHVYCIMPYGVLIWTYMEGLSHQTFIVGCRNIFCEYNLCDLNLYDGESHVLCICV